jgi:hypothetical protein
MGLRNWRCWQSACLSPGRVARCFPMAQPAPDDDRGFPLAAEHTVESIPRYFTAWHHFLAQALRKTRAPGFDVHCFVKLGSLPLEADIIILHLDQQAQIETFAQYFSFLVPCLRPYLILEYKSPDDRLTLADFDTVRAYAYLCKRNYQVTHDEDVAVAMLYSHTEADFFDGCARHGFPFVETQPGVRESSQLAMRFFAIDLVTIGAQTPEHPINLLSARRREYGSSGLPRSLGPFDVLYEQVFLTELKKMSQLHVPGTQELLDDSDELTDVLISRATVERRLRGLSSPDDLTKVLAHATVEQRLRGLSPEDRLRGLGEAERARLRELLLQQEDR